MNFADPTFWAQKTNLAELMQDQKIRDDADEREKQKLADHFKLIKNLKYLRAITNSENNGDKLKQLVMELEGWAERNDLPLSDIQVVSPGVWHGERIVFEIRKHPEAW